MQDYDKLKQAFLQKPQTLAHFADEQNISVSTASHILKTFDISPVRSDAYFQAVSGHGNDILVAYTKLGYSERILAKLFGLTRKSVRKWLVDNNVEIRSFSEGSHLAVLDNSVRKATLEREDLIVDAYIELHMSMDYLAKIFHTTDYQIEEILKKRISLNDYLNEDNVLLTKVRVKLDQLWSEKYGEV